MTIKKRLLYFILFILSQAIYLPLNKYLQGGVALKLPLDLIIPILPGWAIPYSLWMISWFWLSLWATLKMPADLFKSYAAATLIVILSAMVFFTLYPTYVDRLPVQGSGFGTDVLRWVYSNDGLYCAFPSGHIYLATLTALFYSRWHPRSSWFWTIILLIVACSTLFTGQHYILDVVGGLVFALTGTFLGVKLSQPRNIFKKNSSKETASF
ncbi:MAG: phosphatase PAP2 family protein [Leptolinea sp.]